jgi:hypothetical protein
MSALDRLKLLGERADPLTRWQAEAELRTEAEQRQRRNEERERSRERAAMAKSEQVMALRSEIADLRHQLANVRAQIAERDQDIIGIAGTITDTLNKLPGWTENTVEARVKRSEAEMCGKISERFGELMGRLAAIDPALARAKASEPFKFASEKTGDNSDAVELPNPLPPRRAIN